jgi:DNA-directed RNA polymerase sigma subunit (sigma70/sigma32)
MIFNLDNDELKKQIEFLLGMEVQLTADEINVLAHCTIGNEWVLKVLDKLGLTIDDIVYERDRDILRGELSKLRDELSKLYK